MIILFWIILAVAGICISCFFLYKYLNKKLVIFIFSMFSLAGLSVSVLNDTNNYIPWFVCSLPLVVYLIYIMIFDNSKNS